MTGLDYQDAISQPGFMNGNDKCEPLNCELIASLIGVLNPVIARLLSFPSKQGSDKTLTRY